MFVIELSKYVMISVKYFCFGYSELAVDYINTSPFLGIYDLLTMTCTHSYNQNLIGCFENYACQIFMCGRKRWVISEKWLKYWIKHAE